MSDLISRQAAIDAVGNMLRRKFGIGGDLASITLAGLPSAQPERCEDCVNFSKTRLLIPQPERKKGKWIDGQCSECGCDIPAYIIDWKWQKDMDENFCPNCGAKME